tara:strand:- start:10597 stop:11814 length:1218 start_codon:yes stop_codon:yes gene_type:complete
MLMATLGCDAKKSADVAAVPAERLPDVDVPRGDETVKVAVTEEQATAFANQWQQAVIAKDVPTVQALVDWDGIMNRTLRGFAVEKEFRDGFIRGATSPESTLRLIGTISDEVNAGGSYRLVRVTRRAGRSHVTLRLINPDGALNYHDLRLKRSGDAIVADRLFFASTGEAFSDTLRAMVAGAVQSQGSVIRQLTGEVKKEMELLRQQSDMSNAMRRGDNETALAIYEKMPTELQQEKMPMLLRIMATGLDDEDAYLQTIDDFVVRYPNDAAVGLITLDAAVFREDHALLMKSYDQLQRFTGGDTYLDLMVGGVLANQGRLSEAKELTDAIDPADLKLASAHDFKLSVAMAADDHPATLKQLMILRDDYGYALADLSGIEGFEKFVASPQYQQWQASAPAPAASQP